jgi:hypothetical protein
MARVMFLLSGEALPEHRAIYAARPWPQCPQGYQMGYSARPASKTAREAQRIDQIDRPTFQQTPAGNIGHDRESLGAIRRQFHPITADGLLLRQHDAAALLAGLVANFIRAECAFEQCRVDLAGIERFERLELESERRRR